MKSIESSKYEKSKVILDQYIAANHLRHTPERDKVLRYCCEVPSPFSMDQLLARAEADYISRNTVYNTVNLLLKIRVLHCLNKQFDSARKPLYELAIAGRTHTQFVCTKCGKVSAFKPNIIESVIMNRAYTNFKPEHFTLYVYGECKVCKKLINKRKNTSCQ